MNRRSSCDLQVNRGFCDLPDVDGVVKCYEVSSEDMQGNETMLCYCFQWMGFSQNDPHCSEFNLIQAVSITLLAIISCFLARNSWSNVLILARMSRANVLVNNWANVTICSLIPGAFLTSCAIVILIVAKISASTTMYHVHIMVITLMNAFTMIAALSFSYFLMDTAQKMNGSFPKVDFTIKAIKRLLPINFLIIFIMGTFIKDLYSENSIVLLIFVAVLATFLIAFVLAYILSAYKIRNCILAIDNAVNVVDKTNSHLQELCVDLQQLGTRTIYSMGLFLITMVITSQARFKYNASQYFILFNAICYFLMWIGFYLTFRYVSEFLHVRPNRLLKSNTAKVTDATAREEKSDTTKQTDLFAQ